MLGVPVDLPLCGAVGLHHLCFILLSQKAVAEHLICARLSYAPGTQK